MDTLMGIDVGSTTIKALVYDLNGNVISRGSTPTESIANNPDHPNWQVYLPDHIWNGVTSAIRDAVSRMGAGNRILAAAVTGLGADAVPLDEHGKPLYPFINWLCTRTTAQYDWWLKQVGLEKTFEVTGWQPFIWSTVLRFKWLQENEPQIASRVHQWLVIEDYANYRLTGKYSTDYTDASPTLLFDQRSLTWSDELLRTAGIPRNVLPNPQPSGSFIGEVTASAASETGLLPGTPVYQGGHDYLIGAPAAGVLSPGSVLDVTGTWELVLTPTNIPEWKNETQQLGLTLEASAVPGSYCLWGGGTAASMLEWFKDQNGSEAQLLAASGQGDVWTNLMNQARRSPPGANGIFFLPHFNGVTCPNLDPRSLGAFLGLNDNTKKEDMLRAVIEGLDYAFIEMLGAVEQGAGQPADRIIAIGGAVRNDFWVQNKADMCGRLVEAPQIEEATALGAAMQAGVGLGIYKDLFEAAERVHKPGKVFEPVPALTSLYAELIGTYRQIYPALQPVNQRIYDRFRI